jgi:tRNA G37 N-methylase Trm5
MFAGTGEARISRGLYERLTCSLQDTDEKSLQYAKVNVGLNKLTSRIKLLKTDPDGPLIPLDAIGCEQ